MTDTTLKKFARAGVNNNPATCKLLGRRIWLGKKYMRIRLPAEACTLPDGRVVSHGFIQLAYAPHGHSIVKAQPLTLSPSLVSPDPEYPRHFFVRNDVAEFCGDDSICPGARHELMFLPMKWVERVIDLLPPERQPGRIAEAGEDFD